MCAKGGYPPWERSENLRQSRCCNGRKERADEPLAFLPCERAEGWEGGTGFRSQKTDSRAV